MEFADAPSGDFHLRSERGRYDPGLDLWVLDYVTSPCIDVGDPAVYPFTEPTPNGGRVNAGAYGNTAYASRSDWQILSDVNRDGVVNLTDFVIMSQDWLYTAGWVD